MQKRNENKWCCDVEHLLPEQRTSIAIRNIKSSLFLDFVHRDFDQGEKKLALVQCFHMNVVNGSTRIYHLPIILVNAQRFFHGFCLTSIQFSYYNIVFAVSISSYRAKFTLFSFSRQNNIFIEFISLSWMRNLLKCLHSLFFFVVTFLPENQQKCETVRATVAIPRAAEAVPSTASLWC